MRQSPEKMARGFERVTGPEASRVPTLLSTALLISAILPIWIFENFVSQDGSSHLFNAFVMGKVISGQPVYSELFTFNSAFVPNASGHWLMLLLMQVFSPMVAGKVIATICIAGMALACGVLARTLRGEGAFSTGVMVGSLLGMNSSWVTGFYNFSIGLILAVLGIALFVKWRESLTKMRVVSLSIIAMATYLSHLVSFGFIAAALVALSIPNLQDRDWRRVAASALILAPALTAFVLYRAVSVSQGFSPQWVGLEYPVSVIGLLGYLRLADPLLLMFSRQMLPLSGYVGAPSAVISTFVWFGVFFLVSSVALWRSGGWKGLSTAEKMILTVGGVFLIVGFLGPDDLGAQQGAFLRKRLVVFALVCIACVMVHRGSSLVKSTCAVLLATCVLLQVVAVFDYGARNNNRVATYLSAATAIEKGERFSTILVLDDGSRHAGEPLLTLGGLIAIQREAVDLSYEFGYSLFPLITRSRELREFAFDFDNSRIFLPERQPGEHGRRLDRLREVLGRHSDELDKILVYGNVEGLDRILSEKFEETASVSDGRIRVFRRR